jgi:ElaB/YqjD/DUF883 family membrane-anchored ribosome-binding protein
MADVAQDPAPEATPEAAPEAVRDRKERARQALTVINARARKAGDYSTAHIRAHPVRSVGVALGAGLLLGALLLG